MLGFEGSGYTALLTISFLVQIFDIVFNSEPSVMPEFENPKRRCLKSVTALDFGS